MRAISFVTRSLCAFFILFLISILIFDAAPEASAAQEKGSDPKQLLSGESEPSKSEDPSTAKPNLAADPDYVIGPEDVIDIEVFKAPDLNQAARVARDGTIPLRLLGDVKAAGFTASELRAELEDKLKETYLEDPHVSVFVKEYHAQPVSVIGAVEKPGVYHLTGPRTLIEVLSLAGGLAKRSSAPAGRKLYVIRKEGFQDIQLPPQGMQLVAPDKVEIDVRDLLYNHQDSLNLKVKAFDIVSVSKADIIYVLGRGVQKPGGFVLEDRDNVTVLQALAMAEGLSANAAKGYARVIHVGPDGARTEVPLNLDKVIKGKDSDPPLAANDVLFVPDSVQKAAIKRGLEAAVGTVSGIIVFHR